MGVPASSWPGLRLRRFFVEIGMVKKALMPVLKAELSSRDPSFEWKNVAYGKALLAWYLEAEYNSRPMIFNGRELNFKFRAFNKLNKELKEAWIAQVGSEDEKAQQEGASDTTPKAKPKEVDERPFGWGATAYEPQESER